jgi:CyaY protein
MNDLPQSDYLRLAEAALRSVEAAADAADLDSKREGGVLTLELDNGEKIIVNLQPPLQELWLASKSGAYHFRYAGGAWLDTRGSRSFQALLQQALAELGGPALELD